MNYDIIIIGSGISGLYTAYNIKKMSPETSFLILEKYNKNGWEEEQVTNFFTERKSLLEQVLQLTRITQTCLNQ